MTWADGDERPSLEELEAEYFRTSNPIFVHIAAHQAVREGRPLPVWVQGAFVAASIRYLRSDCTFDLNKLLGVTRDHGRATWLADLEDKATQYDLIRRVGEGVDANDALPKRARKPRELLWYDLERELTADGFKGVASTTLGRKWRNGWRTMWTVMKDERKGTTPRESGVLSMR